MKSWKSLPLAVALLGCASLGASLAPAASAQSRTPRAAAPHAEVFSFGGGGRIGATVRDVEPANAKGTAGVVIESIEEGSPAEKAGLKTGDIVVEFDGERVRSVRQFSRLVSETPEGRMVTAAAMRGGQKVTVEVTPESRSAISIFEPEHWAEPLERLRRFERTVPPIPARPATPAPLPPTMDYFFSRSRSPLGISVNELPEQLAEYFGVENGLLVSSVAADSAAAKAGLRAGDVITSVNGSGIASFSDLRLRVQRLKAGEEFSLGIVRDKKTMTLTGKVDTPAERRRGTRTIL